MEQYHVNGSSITLIGGGYIYLGDSSSEIIISQVVPLLGKSFTCNGALYFVSIQLYSTAHTRRVVL